MRRTALKKVKSVLETKPVKHSPNLDDNTIRKLLRNSYSGFQENALGFPWADGSNFIRVQPDSEILEAHWVEPSYLENRSDLSPFWNLFVQKEIIYFEQESFVFLSLKDNAPW